MLYYEHIHSRTDVLEVRNISFFLEVISHSLNFAVKFCTDGLHYQLNFAALAWSPLL
jgi:hypothetical protein